MKAKNILIRLPNWLGDMVMAYPFLYAIQRTYPSATIDLIVKKGLAELVPAMGKFNAVFPFDKKSFRGARGAYRFGRELSEKTDYDLYISLPDSFSSAAMGYGSGATHRVGYRKELRQIMLTHAYSFSDKILHRKTVYLNLLAHYSQRVQTSSCPHLTVARPAQLFPMPSGKNLVFNVNSNADSRRIPVFKAIEYITFWLEKTNYNIILPGHHSEYRYVQAVLETLGSNTRLYNVAGKTSIPQLMALLLQAECLVTTDTGIAHLGNAMGTPTTMLLGAADERVTAPIFSEGLYMPRVPGLSCAPCVRNTCAVGGVPCLTQLTMESIFPIV